MKTPLMVCAFGVGIVCGNTAVRTGFPRASIYSMTKGAIASLVRGVAIDLAPRGITVNNVQPGTTVTDDIGARHGGNGEAADPARAHGQHS